MHGKACSYGGRSEFVNVKKHMDHLSSLGERDGKELRTSCRVKVSYSISTHIAFSSISLLFLQTASGTAAHYDP